MSSISRWLCKNSSKNLFVKIVHPGGHVELHDRPILAAELLDRNPKCCVAHPTVFQNAHAVVSPETTLLLGRKYYVVPLGTIRKLRLKQRRRGKLDPLEEGSSSSVCWLFRNGKNDDEKNGGLRAKIGTHSSESFGDDEIAEMVKRERRGDGNRGPSSSSLGRISLLSVDNWQPALNSICEEYN